ncbi:MAG: zinc-dependent alcohol dehydrogenase family protein [Thermoanaerobaculaceae bacterium]|nr:zinc-dependent alcohol dehydrogenase family protein [Thermoanaerobaculaceae bacterium]
MVLERPGPAASRPLAARLLADPTPGPGQVVLRVLSCGVCRTDLHTVEGDLALPRMPLVPGHQIVGVVEEAAPELGPDMVGRRVGVAWLADACGGCEWCRSGRENLCPSARFTGLDCDGGYAERVAVNAAFTYPLPAGFDAVAAAPLLCAGVIGYRALRLAGALAGGTLGIFGFGASAHVAIQVARHAGCRVFVFTRAARHHDHARTLGASWAGSPGEPPPARLDHAVIFSPAGEQAPLALSLLGRGGCVACAGVTMSDLPSFPYDLLYHERTLRSVANATRADATELLALAQAIPITTSVERVPLAQANDALVRVKESRVTGALVLVPD